MKLHFLSILLFIASIGLAQQTNKSSVEKDSNKYEVKKDNTLQGNDNSSENTDSSKEIINFQVVDFQPVYNGCEVHETKQDRYICFTNKIMDHIRNNFTYPDIAKEMGIQGMVIVQFIIDKNGYVTSASILRGIDRNLDKEALRIVSLIPKMQSPAYQQKVAVPVSFLLPITFKLK